MSSPSSSSLSSTDGGLVLAPLGSLTASKGSCWWLIRPSLVWCSPFASLFLTNKDIQIQIQIPAQIQVAYKAKSRLLLPFLYTSQIQINININTYEYKWLIRPSLVWCSHFAYLFFTNKKIQIPAQIQVAYKAKSRLVLSILNFQIQIEITNTHTHKNEL